MVVLPCFVITIITPEKKRQKRLELVNEQWDSYWHKLATNLLHWDHANQASCDW